MLTKKSIQTPEEWFAFLGELSRTINIAPGNLKTILDALVQKLIQRVGVDAIAIWTVEEDTNFMKVESSSGLSERYIRFFNKTDRIRAGKGLVGQVMSSRKSMFFRSIEEYRNIGILRWNKMLEEEGVTAIFAAPMFVGERVVGTFNVYYKKGLHDFNIYEQQFLEVLANHVAIVIENIKNYRVIEEDRKNLKDQIEKLISLQDVIQLLNLHDA